MDNNPNTARLQRWLRPLMFPFDATAPVVATLELKHSNVSGKHTPLRKWQVDAARTKDEGEDYLKYLTGQVEDAAQDDADGVGGVNAYVVQAATAEGDLTSRCTLRVRGASDGEEEGDELATEPATAKGLVTQLMRHNNNAERIAVGATGQVILAQQRMITKLVDSNERLTTKAMEVMELRENLLNQQQVRDLELEEEKGKQARRAKLLDHAITVLGPAAKGLLGAVGVDVGQGSPVKAALEVQTVRDLANSLDEGQFAAIKKVLSPLQFFSLLSLLEQAQGGDAKERDESDGVNGVGVGSSKPFGEGA